MKAVSYWLWIAGSVIAGLLVFAAGYKYMSSAWEENAELDALESFEGLVSTVNDLCWSFTGSKREYTLKIYENVLGIYASRSKHEKYKEEELKEKIKNKEISEGDYLCIQIKNKRLKCLHLECNVSLPYLGFLSEDESLQSFLNKLSGKGKFTSCKLNLEKKSLKVEIGVK